MMHRKKKKSNCLGGECELFNDTTASKNMLKGFQSRPRFHLHPVSTAPGPGGPLSGVVQGLQPERLPGRHRQVVPAAGEFDHAHSAAVRGQPDGRQREHGPPLLRVAFELPCGEAAAGHRWARSFFKNTYMKRKKTPDPWPLPELAARLGLCETDNMNKAGYTPVMLAALTAADSPDDLEVAQQLLKLGNVNACSRQVR